VLADHRLFLGDKIELPNFKFVIESFDVEHRVVHKDERNILFINFRVLQNLGLKNAFPIALIKDLQVVFLFIPTLSN